LPKIGISKTIIEDRYANCGFCYKENPPRLGCRGSVTFGWRGELPSRSFSAKGYGTRCRRSKPYIFDCGYIKRRDIRLPNRVRVHDTYRANRRSRSREIAYLRLPPIAHAVA